MKMQEKYKKKEAKPEQGFKNGDIEQVDCAISLFYFPVLFPCSQTPILYLLVYTTRRITMTTTRVLTTCYY